MFVLTENASASGKLLLLLPSVLVYIARIASLMNSEVLRITSEKS